LLRCTSSRCVWLRQTVAALPPPDQSLHSAFRRRPWIKIKIKSGSRACAHPGVGRHAPRAGCTYLPCRSCRRLRSFDLAFALLWELACQRWRPDSRPISGRCIRSTCGSEPAREDACAGEASLPAIVVSRCQKGFDRSRFGTQMATNLLKIQPRARINIV